jgi:hypothetical protein
MQGKASAEFRDAFGSYQAYANAQGKFTMRKTQ